MTRMMSPDGEMVEIPEENVDAAIAAGARVMTDIDLVNLFNRSELERRFFERDWKKSHQPMYRKPRGHGRW